MANTVVLTPERGDESTVPVLLGSAGDEELAPIETLDRLGRLRTPHTCQHRTRLRLMAYFLDSVAYLELSDAEDTADERPGRDVPADAVGELRNQLPFPKKGVSGPRPLISVGARLLARSLRITLHTLSL